MLHTANYVASPENTKPTINIGSLVYYILPLRLLCSPSMCRLNAVSHMIRVQSSTDILAERLRTLEHKIDQMMDAVSHNSTGE